MPEVDSFKNYLRSLHLSGGGDGGGNDDAVDQLRADLTPAAPSNFELLFNEEGPYAVQWSVLEGSNPPFQWRVEDSVVEGFSVTTTPLWNVSLIPTHTDSITVVAQGAFLSEPATFEYEWAINEYPDLTGSSSWDGGDDPEAVVINTILSGINGEDRQFDLQAWRRVDGVWRSAVQTAQTSESGEILISDTIYTANYGTPDWVAGTLWLLSSGIDRGVITIPFDSVGEPYPEVEPSGQGD